MANTVPMPREGCTRPRSGWNQLMTGSSPVHHLPIVPCPAVTFQGHPISSVLRSSINSPMICPLVCQGAFPAHFSPPAVCTRSFDHQFPSSQRWAAAQWRPWTPLPAVRPCPAQRSTLHPHRLTNNGIQNCTYGRECRVSHRESNREQGTSPATASSTVASDTVENRHVTYEKTKCSCGREDNMETSGDDSPTVDKTALSLLAVHMKKYVQEWKQSKKFHDPFWQRKSHKVVLAVVMVRQRPAVDGSCVENNFLFFRGINTEVSLPAGSLCAERVAIASAVSSQPSIRRQDFVMLAVVDPQNQKNPIKPCGVCQETITKIHEVSSGFRAVSFTSSSCDEVSVDYSVDASSNGLDSDS
eukprot:GHVS01069224.1.p1 GENE.GHVS01069224.1~~GHVS01069224.1.p1  ORF type:complete len:357 (-),score=35.29 GHVS01069224.1:373-1443(-)